MYPEPTYPVKINDKLHDDLTCVPPSSRKEMNEKVRDILMQYAFTFSHDYKKAYQGGGE